MPKLNEPVIVGPTWNKNFNKNNLNLKIRAQRRRIKMAQERGVGGLHVFALLH